MHSSFYAKRKRGGGGEEVLLHQLVHFSVYVFFCTPAGGGRVNFTDMSAKKYIDAFSLNAGGIKVLSYL